MYTSKHVTWKIINFCIIMYIYIIIYNKLHVHDSVCFSSCCKKNSAKYGCLVTVFVLNLEELHRWVFSAAVTGEDCSDSPQMSCCLSWCMVPPPGIFLPEEQYLGNEE